MGIRQDVLRQVLHDNPLVSGERRSRDASPEYRSELPMAFIRDRPDQQTSDA